MSDMEPVIIIGAGLGGLSAAIHLAVKKRPVMILEKNEKVGGKMSEFRLGGYRWDTGPSVITMLDVLEDLFKTAGRKLNESMQLIPVEPGCRYFFADGKRLDVWRDLPRTIAGIHALDALDVEGYLSFLAHAACQYRLTGPAYIYGPPPTMSSLFKIGISELTKVDVFRSLDTVVREHVHSPYLRQILNRFATYVGTNPSQAPGMLSTIAYLELSSGLWYPRGGVFSIAQALGRLANELGVKILTKTAVQEIVVKDREVRGVLLADGTMYETRTVISNVDVATTFASLLPKKPPYSWELEKFQPASLSTSAFILMMGVKGRFNDLTHHNVFLPKDSHKEYEQIFSKGMPPDDPTIRVCITCKNDSNHAPTGSENWAIMVNVPPKSTGYDWSIQAASYRDVVLASLARHGYDVKDKVEVEQIFTPLDMEQHNGAYNGALYGLSFNNWMAPFRRPHPRAKVPSGLFFAGSTTHPGGGVPMAILSGKYTAQIVDKTLA